MAPVFGYTISGRWGHDTDFQYRPGSYIYETPMVHHRFMNGPEETEALFVSLGDVEHLDPDSREVIGRLTPELAWRTYMEALERAGKPRPDIST